MKIKKWYLSLTSFMIIFAFNSSTFAMSNNTNYLIEADADLATRIGLAPPINNNINDPVIFWGTFQYQGNFTFNIDQTQQWMWLPQIINAIDINGNSLGPNYPLTTTGNVTIGSIVDSTGGNGQLYMVSKMDN